MSAAWPSGLRRYFGNHSTRSSRFDSRPCHNLKKFFCYSSSCNEYFGNIYLHYSTTHYQLWFIYLKCMKHFFSKTKHYNKCIYFTLKSYIVSKEFTYVNVFYKPYNCISIPYWLCGRVVKGANSYAILSTRCGFESHHGHIYFYILF